MTENTRVSLRELQALDQEIQAAKDQIEAFGPRLDEVEGPTLQLESEVEATRKRLREIQLEERRLELAADERRARSNRLQARMNTVRNLREEAAVHAELDLVRRALEGDEQEALGLLDQIRKLEERLAELEADLETARAEVEPKRNELMAELDAARTANQERIARREAFADRIDPTERRLYDSIRAGGRTVVVAELTPDGACGHCFSVIPLQFRRQIRTSRPRRWCPRPISTRCSRDCRRQPIRRPRVLSHLCQ